MLKPLLRPLRPVLIYSQHSCKNGWTETKVIPARTWRGDELKIPQPAVSTDIRDLSQGLSRTSRRRTPPFGAALQTRPSQALSKLISELSSAGLELVGHVSLHELLGRNPTRRLPAPQAPCFDLFQTPPAPSFEGRWLSQEAPLCPLFLFSSQDHSEIQKWLLSFSG